MLWVMSSALGRTPQPGLLPKVPVARQDVGVAGDPRDVLTRSARPPDAVVAYGPGPEQFGEVWWPVAPADQASERSVLVLVVHGGFWQSEWDRMHARPMAAALADEGFVVGSVEYRRIGSAGGWPGTFDDIAAAVDRLPEMIKGITPSGVHTEGVVLIGHSAGGHLVLWAAARHRLPTGVAWHHADSPAVTGVVALAPVSALSRADREDVGEGAVAQLVGGHADEVPNRYALVDPTALAPSGVRTVLVHGDEDHQVPVAHSRSYVEAARTLGDDVTLVQLSGTEHFAVIDPLSAAWPTVLRAVRSIS